MRNQIKIKEELLCSFHDLRIDDCSSTSINELSLVFDEKALVEFLVHEAVGDFSTAHLACKVLNCINNSADFLCKALIHQTGSANGVSVHDDLLGFSPIVFL